jgi:predicted RNase H-like HicB family nuclease
MQYSVVVHNAEEGGFWVEVPALPGCYSQGESVDESLQNVTEAIELYLESLRDEGQDAPLDAEVVYQVNVAV